VIETERAWQARGEIKYGPTAIEEKARLRRRSIYITKDMRAGQMFTSENLRCIRPGLGLPPKYYDIFLGKKINRNVKLGTPLTWKLIG
jgi:sialic acid synthase SpsE